MSSRRRLSIGGAARTSALRDGSSRFNSSSGASLARRRQSFGGGLAMDASPQKSRPRTADSPSRAGLGVSSRLRSSSASRRQSIDADSHRSETPAKDRRAMLQAWRQARRGNHGGDEDSTIDLGASKKRSAPPLPPSDTRKIARVNDSQSRHGQQHAQHQQQQQQQQQQHQLQNNQQQHPPQQQQQQHSFRPDENETITFSQGSISTNYYDDDTTADFSRASSSLLSARTPTRRKGRLGSARRKSFMPPRPVVHNDDFEMKPAEPSSPLMSQLTQESEDLDVTITENMDSVEGAGLMSQLQRLKKRVEQLEKEKMDLSMSKAPLEARFRQKEDAWVKEEAKLLQEIDESKNSLREADEQYRDLEVKYDNACDDVKGLKLELRKASSTSRQGNTDNSLWSRQLQNDRDLSEMKDKLRVAEEEIDSMRLGKVSVEKELHATKIELSCLERNYDELRVEYDDIAASTSENNEAEIKLEVLTAEHMATSAQLNAVCDDLAATKARAEATLQAKDEEHKKDIEQLHFEMSVLKTRASKVRDEDMETDEPDEEDEAVLRARIEERDRRITELEAELLKGEQMRRQMHNTIQELRGNIRVYVRTRPFLPGDEQCNGSPIDVSPDGESLAIMDRRSADPYDFRFDKVFPPSAGQDIVFDEVSDFVQSALDGYQVCLFSYGQTGSGKTHTMQGCGNGAMRGIIPRAVEQILSQAKAMTSQKWNFTIHASFLEIYNENLKDLLVSMQPGGGGSNDGKRNRADATKLSIKRNREGKSFVDGLTHVPITIADSAEGMSQLDTLMGVAARSRSVASTKMNAQSSRSHSVFMLHLKGFNEETGAIVHGALNLCDLAGSERLDRSGAGADAARLRETQAINKSLSCLGDVFNALATGASHVPYRNSKLTYLLQDCLSGDGKALMFVNLSPTTASSNESLCSLRFAQRVNTVELGKATKHVQYSSKGRR